MFAAIEVEPVPTIKGAFVALVDAALHPAPSFNTVRLIVAEAGAAEEISVILQILQKDGIGYTVTIQLVVEV
jgi:hypothetical protein